LTTRDTEPGSGGSATGALRLLRANRAFRSLWCARGVSFLGDSLGLVTLLLYVAGETGQALAVALLLLVGDFAPSLPGPFTGVLSGLWEWGSFTLSGGRGIEAYERTATVLQPG
jgi:hypothetical protein